MPTTWEQYAELGDKRAAVLYVLANRRGRRLGQHRWIGQDHEPVLIEATGAEMVDVHVVDRDVLRKQRPMNAEQGIPLDPDDLSLRAAVGSGPLTAADEVRQRVVDDRDLRTRGPRVEQQCLMSIHDAGD